MAPNRRPQPEAEAEADEDDGSSSEEEEEASSSENQEHEASESESEEEKDKTSTALPKKPSAPKKPETTTQTSTNPQSSSSGDFDSESDSPAKVDPNIKPIASKPMEEPPKATKKPRSKPSSSATPAAVKKRQAESEKNRNREPKRSKKKAGDADAFEDTAKKIGDDSKKQLFQRLWSEDDEIVILKGMIEYTAKKAADPVAEMNAFHDFIKKSLHVDVSKTQLSDKVRRLKKKYENNASKGEKGEDRTFSKPHDQKAYELSKKIWGGEANNGVGGVDSTKVNRKARKAQNQNSIVALPKIDGVASANRAKEGIKKEAEPNSGVSLSLPVRFNRSFGESSLEEEIIKNGLELITGPKKSELEEKWKKFRVEEIELYLKRVDLIREQTKLVLEALKSSSGH